MDEAKAEDDLALRRKQLLYRSIYTGMKETDILLDLYQNILEAGDPLILAWLMGREAVPAGYDNDVMKLLLNFKSYKPSN